MRQYSRLGPYTFHLGLGKFRPQGRQGIQTSLNTQRDLCGLGPRVTHCPASPCQHFNTLPRLVIAAHAPRRPHQRLTQSLIPTPLLLLHLPLMGLHNDISLNLPIGRARFSRVPGIATYFARSSKQLAPGRRKDDPRQKHTSNEKNHTPTCPSIITHRSAREAEENTQQNDKNSSKNKARAWRTRLISTAVRTPELIHNVTPITPLRIAETTFIATPRSRLKKSAASIHQGLGRPFLCPWACRWAYQGAG